MPTVAPGETFPASKYNSLGIVAQFVDTTDDGPHTGDTVTDMVLNNVPVIQGDTYAIHLHTGGQLSASPSNWSLECRVNATVIGRFGFFDADATTDCDGTVYWTAPTTQATDDFDVFANENSGAGNLTLRATATIPRWLTIINLSAL